MEVCTVLRILALCTKSRRLVSSPEWRLRHRNRLARCYWRATDLTMGPRNSPGLRRTDRSTKLPDRLRRFCTVLMDRTGSFQSVDWSRETTAISMALRPLVELKTQESFSGSHQTARTVWCTTSVQRTTCSVIKLSPA